MAYNNYSFMLKSVKHSYDDELLCRLPRNGEGYFYYDTIHRLMDKKREKIIKTG